MVADALAPHVAMSSATMVLIMQDKQVRVFHKKEFQLHAPTEYWKMIENTNICYVS